MWEALILTKRKIGSKTQAVFTNKGLGTKRTNAIQLENWFYKSIFIPPLTLGEGAILNIKCSSITPNIGHKLCAMEIHLSLVRLLSNYLCIKKERLVWDACQASWRCPPFPLLATSPLPRDHWVSLSFSYSWLPGNAWCRMFRTGHSHSGHPCPTFSSKQCAFSPLFSF